MLSNPCSSVSSAGSSARTSTSSASRSRIALAYSVRFSRWSGGRPGFGCAAAARSSPVSSDAISAATAGLVRPRAADRRHRAGAQLADDLLPDLGVLGGTGGIDRVERQAGGLQPLVVAGDAVPVEDRARRCGVRRRLLHGRAGKRLDPRRRIHRGRDGCQPGRPTQREHEPRHQEPPAGGNYCRRY